MKYFEVYKNLILFLTTKYVTRFLIFKHSNTGRQNLKSSIFAFGLTLYCKSKKSISFVKKLFLFGDQRKRIGRNLAIYTKKPSYMRKLTISKTLQNLQNTFLLVRLKHGDK